MANLDDEGNLVEPGAFKPDSGGNAPAEPSEVVTPEQRTILLILAVAYGIVSVPVFIWMSRSTQRKVDESRRLYSSS